MQVSTKHCDTFTLHVEQARIPTRDESYAHLLRYIWDGNNKTSHAKLEERKDKYAKGVDKEKKKKTKCLAEH